MPARRLDATLSALEQAREPHALVTVVWTRGRGSGKAGDRAVVTADGTLHGWIGGACALDKVRRECARALEGGAPRVLCIGSPDDFPSTAADRVLEPVTCASEGAYEMFIEPRFPRPQLVILGDSPFGTTLARLGRALDYRIVAGTSPGVARPEADLHVEGADLSEVKVDADTFVVVATQGQWDFEALEAALSTPAPYVALVASPRRWAALRGSLESAGVDGRRLDRVRAPAGLDLGPLPHDEIAVSVLAEIVRTKAAARRHRAPVTTAGGGGASAGEAAPRTRQDAPRASCCSSKKTTEDRDGAREQL